MKTIVSIGAILASFAHAGCGTKGGLAGEEGETFKPEHIYAGGNATCMTGDGRTYCWGLNHLGQLLDGTKANSNVPVETRLFSKTPSSIAIGGTSSSEYYPFGCALIGGGVQCHGDDQYGQTGTNTDDEFFEEPTSVAALSSGVDQLSVGNLNACAIAGGSISCWGYGGGGQLGDGGTSSSGTPVAVSGIGSSGDATFVDAGEFHTCAVIGEAAYCWGTGSDGRLGNSGTGDSLVPVAVSGMTTAVTTIAAGSRHSCAIMAGAAYCWGEAGEGQVGDGTTADKSDPVPVSGLTEGVTAISTVTRHTCAIVNGGVQCWGSNSSRAVGSGSVYSGGEPMNATAPVAVSGLTEGVDEIALGASHSCALKDGKVWCWGTNLYGQLGDGTNESSLDPVEVKLPTITSE